MGKITKESLEIKNTIIWNSKNKSSMNSRLGIVKEQIYGLEDTPSGDSTEKPKR